jgi:hypothetical protein
VTVRSSSKVVGVDIARTHRVLADRPGKIVMAVHERVGPQYARCPLKIPVPLLSLGIQSRQA